LTLSASEDIKKTKSKNTEIDDIDEEILRFESEDYLKKNESSKRLT
jgi:hypothetical protein